MILCPSEEKKSVVLKEPMNIITFINFFHISYVIHNLLFNFTYF